MLGTEVIGLVTWNDFVTGVRVRKGDSRIGLFYSIFFVYS